MTTAADVIIRVRPGYKNGFVERVPNLADLATRTVIIIIIILRTVILYIGSVSPGRYL
jgi:hypothetical protein